MVETNENWLQEMFINEAKAALDNHSGSGGSSDNDSVDNSVLYPDTLIFEGGTLKGNAAGVMGDEHEAAVKISDYCPPEHELNGAYCRVWWMADDGEGVIETREYRELCSAQIDQSINAVRVSLSGELGQCLFYCMTPDGITDESLTEDLGMDMSTPGMYLLAFWPIAGVLTKPLHCRIELILNKNTTPYLAEKLIDRVTALEAAGTDTSE